MTTEIWKLDDLVTSDRTMAELFARVKRVGLGVDPVLILGETGTGKEGIARAIHRISGRRRMESLNCAVLSGDLANSELFGHERGAFTGADRRYAGVFERVAGGTVFLDEMGELAPQVQARLLRVLEAGRFRRVGGSVEVSTATRLICATHRNLAGDVADGRFRRDLFYRIGVLVLSLPPLRERPGDVAMLADRFLRARRPRMSLTGPVIRRLQSHHWPGNVRELKNLMYRFATEWESSTVTLDTLEQLWTDRCVVATMETPVPGRSWEEIRAVAVLAELERQEGNVSATSRVLGLARSTIYEILRSSSLAPRVLSGSVSGVS